MSYLNLATSGSHTVGRILQGSCAGFVYDKNSDCNPLYYSQSIEREL